MNNYKKDVMLLAHKLKKSSISFFRSWSNCLLVAHKRVKAKIEKMKLERIESFLLVNESRVLNKSPFLILLSLALISMIVPTQLVHTVQILTAIISIPLMFIIGGNKQEIL